MELQNFISGLAEQFDDINPVEITGETKFKELTVWGSLATLLIISYVKTRWGKNITGSEIRSCETVRDLFDLTQSK